MSLLWLLVTDCEQRGCIHQLHIMSLWWLRVSDCGQAEGGLLAMHRESNEAGGIRLRTTGLFSPAVHHEFAVASGIRLRTMGLFLSTMLLKAAGAPRDGLEQGDSSLPRVEQKAVRTSSVKVVHVSCINEKVMIPVKES